MEQRNLRLDTCDLSPQLPAALARLHWELPVGGRLILEVPPSPPGWPGNRLADLVTGAGFEPDTPVTAPSRRMTARRLRTLPDTVAAGMRVLVCGLNPSLFAADAGFGYAGPTNRFWPAALGAGLVTAARDPLHALLGDRVGMTDLVKRATPAAGALTTAEYRSGLDRVERLAGWLRPERILFVGLAGWRAAVDRTAGPGWQPPGRLAVPAYVMPSTSGLNARTRLDALIAHMAAALAPPPVA